jgi:uncharacterized protein (TIGR03437 family)
VGRRLRDRRPTAESASAVCGSIQVQDTLLIELRGEPGSTVEIGVKDNTQADDGTEAKVILPIFGNWRTYAIPVAQFNRAAISKLYVVAEIVFSGPQAQNLWCRSIKYTDSAAPVITGASNAASFREGIGASAWASVTGQDLSAIAHAWGDADFQGNKLPKALGGTSINLNDRDMPVSYVSPTQVNTLVLEDMAAGESYLSVTNAVGTSVPSRMIVRPLFPGCFTLPVEGGRYVAAVHADGVLAGKPGLLGPLAPTRPVKPADILQIFCTGFGATDPAGIPDEISTVPRPTANPDQIEMRIGGAAADLLFAGVIEPGLYQLNVRVPDLPDGDQPVYVAAASFGIRQELYLTVQR